MPFQDNRGSAPERLDVDSTDQCAKVDIGAINEVAIYVSFIGDSGHEIILCVETKEAIDLGLKIIAAATQIQAGHGAGKPKAEIKH